MSEPFIAEIRIWGCNFAPYGWAFCDGQLLPISQYTALFSLVGTYYGGNGTSTFALPNMQGRAAMEWGSGSGLTSRFIGETLGEQSVTVLSSELPQHSHTVVGAEPAGPGEASAEPSIERWLGSSNPQFTYSSGSPDALFAPQVIGNSGGGVPHNNMQPYETLNFCIALDGLYPSRA